MFSAPEAQGIDSRALARALEWIRAKQIPVHSLFVERNGRAILDAYFFPFRNNETHDLASVTKSVVSSLVGVAGSEGGLDDLNAPLSALLPVETRALDDPRKGAVSLANLLDMTSGLDCDAAPGENLLLEMERTPDWVSFMLNRPFASAPGSRFQKDAGGMKEASFHLTLLAMNRIGFQNLVKLSTSAFLEGFYYKPRIDKELLEAHSEGIICLSGCVSGEFSRTLLQEEQGEPRWQRAMEIAGWFQRVFGERIEESGSIDRLLRRAWTRRLL